MEANCHHFFGLAAEREACIAFRKSRLMLANSFLVGTFFSASRFSFASTQHLPHDGRFQLKAQLHRRLRMAVIVLEAFQEFVNEHVVWAAHYSEPFFPAV